MRFVIVHYEKRCDRQGRMWLEDTKPLTPESKMSLYRYGSNGNIINETYHFADKTMIEITNKYYRGRLVSRIERRGKYPHPTEKEIKTRFEYNGKGQLVHKKSSDGNETWYKYDDRGNKVYEKNNEKETFWLYEYYSNGQIKKETEYEPKEEK